MRWFKFIIIIVLCLFGLYSLSMNFVDESKSDVNSDNLKQEIENIKPKEINNLNNENGDIKFKSKMVDVVKNLFK